MHTIEFPHKKITLEIPASWDEFTPAQHDYVMQQVLKLESNIITIYDFKVYCLYHFLGLKRTPWSLISESRLSQEKLEDKYFNIFQLTQLLDFMFEKINIEDKQVLKLNYFSIINFYPTIESFPYDLIGPCDALTDISFGEYRTAVECFRQFSESKDEKDLNKLVACLYRKERENFKTISETTEWDGQRKEKFNRNLIEKNSVLVEEIPFYKKFAIFLFFRNCLNYIRYGEVQIEGKIISFERLFSEAEEGETDNDNIGLVGTLYKVAETGIFGTIEKVDEANLFDVLLKLYQWKVEYEQFKSKTNDKSNKP